MAKSSANQVELTTAQERSAEIKARKRDRVVRELKDAGIKGRDDLADDPRIKRCCDEIRAIRLRYDRYTDEIINKAMKQKMVGWLEGIEKRREFLRQKSQAIVVKD